MKDCLFNVRRKSDNTTVKVYAVRDDKCGYPHFLIYEDKEWKYVKAKHFVDDEEVLNEETRQI